MASSSYKTRASVECVGAAPSSGSRCTNAVIGSVRRHAASSSSPSTDTADATDCPAAGTGSTRLRVPRTDTQAHTCRITALDTEGRQRVGVCAVTVEKYQQVQEWLQPSCTVARC